MKPCCTGSSSPSFSSPSTVRISWPDAIAASTVHDFTGSPSICPTQGPQVLVSQPQWVPVMFRSSRRKCTSSIRGSTSPLICSPFTVMFTCTSSPPGHALERAAQCPLGQLRREVELVLGRSALVGARRAVLRGHPPDFVDHLVGRLLATQRLL